MAAGFCVPDRYSMVDVLNPGIVCDNDRIDHSMRTGN